MSELRIVRGIDVKLSADNTPLFGVLSFSAVEKIDCHKVYECMSCKPCAYVPQGVTYELRLGVMALFDRQLPTEEAFTLQIADGDTIYDYEGCRVTERKSEIKENGCAVEVFVIGADRLRKRRSDE